MHVYQNRVIFGDDATISTLHINDNFSCFILEDEVREGEKIPGETAIPYGTFECELRTEGGFHQRYSQRFLNDPVINHIGMVHLLGVPDFTYIQMHPGNTDDHTEGCPITGLNLIKRNDGHLNYNLGRGTDGYRFAYPPISLALKNGETVLWHIKKADYL